MFHKYFEGLVFFFFLLTSFAFVYFEEVMLKAFNSFSSMLDYKLALDASVYNYRECSFWFIVLVFLNFSFIFCCELYLARFLSCVWPIGKKKKMKANPSNRVSHSPLEQDYIFGVLSFHFVYNAIMEVCGYLPSFSFYVGWFISSLVKTKILPHQKIPS